MADTKLTKSQKAWAKEAVANFEALGGKVIYDAQTGVTVAMTRPMPGANSVRVYVSVAASSESKYRKWVGIHNVMDSVASGMEFITIPCEPYLEAELADNLQIAFGRARN